MRKLALAAALAAPLTLGGCGATGTIPIVGPIITSVLSIPAIQAGAKAVCGFNPLAQDVATLLSANPLVVTVAGIVNLICTAVNAQTPASVAHRGVLPSQVTVPPGVVVRRAP